MFGGIATAGGLLSTDNPINTRSVPLPTLDDSAFQIGLQSNPAGFHLSILNARNAKFFSGLSIVSPSAPWANGHSSKLAAFEPTPFDDINPADGDSSINNFFNPPASSAGSGLSVGSSTVEIDSSISKTVAIPLPAAGVLGIVGIGAIAARRRRI